MEANKTTEEIIGCSIQIHRFLGPGLPDPAGEECICCDLAQCGTSFRSQVDVHIVSRSVKPDRGYRMDLAVEDLVVVEIMAVEQIAKIHEVQLLSCLRSHNEALGMLINFHTSVVNDGIRRIVNNFEETSASRRHSVEALIPNGEML